MTFKRIKKRRVLKSVFSSFCAVIFLAASLAPSCVQAQMVLPSTAGQGIQLPVPGSVVPLSPVYIPPALRGMKVYPENPLNFDFILDTGDSDFDDNRLRQESNKLIKYFLATLTVPADDLWVNLSPYEADRIIPNGFGVTEMGRDLLAQDYILKQLTASLLNPEDELGGRFWEKIYQVAADRYGVKDIPIDTFNKVWIVPDKAVVYQNGNAAFIGESHLKVMLEKDYFAFIQGREFQEEPTKELGNVSAAIIKEIIIPEIEKEVNTGENFAPVRQIYHSMILASWFREKIKDSILNNIYVGQNKVDGIDIEDKAVAEKIYSQYLEAFQKGVYDYIREEYDPQTQNVVARHYFSGGVTLTDEVLEVKEGLPPADQMTAKGRFLVARGSFDPLNKPENTGDSSKGIIGTAMEGYDDGIIDSLNRILNKAAAYYGNEEALSPLIDRPLRDTDKLALDKVFQWFERAGFSSEQVNRWRQRVNPIDVKENRLFSEKGRIGGVIVSHQGELHTIFPRSHLLRLKRRDIGDLLHELVEIELREGSNLSEEHAHSFAAYLTEKFNLYTEFMPYAEALTIIKGDLDAIIEKNSSSRMTLREYESEIPFFPVKRTRGSFESVIRVMGQRYDKYIKVSLSENLTPRATNSDFEKFVFILQDIIVKMQRDWDWNDFNMGIVERIQIKQGSSINFSDPVVLEIPFQKIAGLSDLSTDSSEFIKRFNDLKREIFQAVIFYRMSNGSVLTKEQFQETYKNYVENSSKKTPFYPDAPQTDYRIVVPVHNEEERLEKMLQRFKDGGYLGKAFFVNDKSTDRSEEILREWEEKEGLEVLHLTENKRKEGAIRDVMEKLSAEGRLPDHVIVMDSDSFLEVIDNEKSMQEMVDQAVYHMKVEGHAAMSFLHDIYLDEKPENIWLGILQRAQYADFAALRTMNRMAAESGKMLVLNGRGGVFNSATLLQILRGMKNYDFETGDITITNEIMKQGKTIGYFDKIKVVTEEERSFKDYRAQRTRWERSFLKMLLKDWDFYQSEIKAGTSLGAIITGSLFLRFTYAAAPFYMASQIYQGQFGVGDLLAPVAFWGVINGALASTDKGVRSEGYGKRIWGWGIYNALVFSSQTIFAIYKGAYQVANSNLQEILNQRKTGSKDNAQLIDTRAVSNNEQRVGGINLNPEMLDLQLEGDFAGIQFDAQKLKSMSVTGFRPFVAQLIPIDDLSKVLDAKVSVSYAIH